MEQNPKNEANTNKNTQTKGVFKYIPNKENGKLKLEEKIKTFFKKQLKCSWKNVINYSNGTRTQEIRIVKEGDYFNQDITKTNNNQFFGLNSISIVSIYERNNNTVIGEDPEIKLNYKYSKIYLIIIRYFYYWRIIQNIN